MGSTSSSRGTGPCELVPDALGFLPRPSWPAAAARPWSSAPPGARASGSCAPRRWPTASPSWRPPSAACRESVRHARTGFLVEPGNPAALRVAIKLLLADPALRHRLERTPAPTSPAIRLAGGHAGHRRRVPRRARRRGARARSARGGRVIALRKAPSSYDERFMDTMANEYLERTPWTELRLAAVRDLVDPQPGGPDPRPQVRRRCDHALPLVLRRRVGRDRLRAARDRQGARALSRVHVRGRGRDGASLRRRELRQGRGRRLRRAHRRRRLPRDVRRAAACSFPVGRSRCTRRTRAT